MQSQQKAGLSLPPSIAPSLLSLGFTDTQSEAKGEEIREEEERGKEKGRVKERFKGLWDRNEAAGLLGCATAWAQFNPKGICEVSFRHA